MVEGEPILQFNGVFCLLKEAFKVTTSMKVLISLQTVVFVLPLSMLKLSYLHIQDHFFKNDSSLVILLFMIAYSLFNSIFSLPSTTAVIHTIKCIDEAKEVTFKNILSEIPKSSKRITSLGYLYITFNYIYIAISLDHLLMWDLDTWIANYEIKGYLFLVVLLLVGFIAFACMYFCCILIYTVTVAEGTYATHVKEKIDNEHVFKIFTRGRMWTASAIVLVVHFSLIMIEMAYIGVVIHGKSVHTVLKFIFGFAFSILLSTFIMFGLILQSLVYFVSVPRAVRPVDDV